MKIFLRLSRIVVLSVGGFFVGMLVLILFFQSKLIYHPSKDSEADLLKSAAGLALEPWRDKAGTLIGWRSKEVGAVNRLLVFHGNADNALDRAHLAHGFESIDGARLWEVYLFEYPGYSCRAGEPGEEAIKSAARAAFEELKSKDERPLFIAGESIGTGVAAYLAQFKAVAGVFLITPFSNLGEVATFHYPFLPIGILHEKYDSAEALKEYRGPVAMVLAGEDQIIPAKLGQKLFDGYGGPKRVWVDKKADHHTVDFDAQEVSDFLLKR